MRAFTRWKSLTAVLGLVPILGAIWFLAWPDPAKRMLQAPDGVVVIRADTLFPISCLFCSSRDTIEIRYPATMRLNQSAVVEISLSSTGVIPFREDTDLPLITASPLSIGLNAVSFDVAPTGKVEKARGSQLPLLWRWVIAPKSTGEHTLVADLESLHLVADKGEVGRAGWSGITGGSYVELSVNDGEAQWQNTTDLRSVVLKVKVRTKEGLSDVAQAYIGYVLAAIGSILLYPAVAERVSALLRRRRRRPADSLGHRGDA